MEQCWASLGIEIVLGALKEGRAALNQEPVGRRSFLREVSEEGLRLTPLLCLVTQVPCRALHKWELPESG